MKKILTSAMAIAITGTSAMVVVSCTTPKRQIPYTLNGNLAIKDYSNDENKIAINGGENSAYKGRVPFTFLINKLTNVISQTSYMYPTISSYEKAQKSFVGADQGEDKLTIDGLWTGDSEGEVDFYNKYKNKETKIATLEGLYRYAKATKDTSIMNPDDVDVKEFYNGYLGLDGSAYDSSFVDIQIDSSAETKQSYETPTILGITAKKEEDKETSELIFDKDTAIKNFTEINTNVEDDLSKNKIGNQNANPFNILTLGTEAPALVQTIEKVETKDNYLDANRITDKWDFQYKETTKDEKTTTSFISTLSKLVPVAPLNLTYTYDTNVRNANSTKFTIDMTVDGLTAVYSPVLLNANRKDENGKPVGDYKAFAVWVLNGYQFNTKYDTANISDANKSRATYGYFSNINISNLSIKKVISETNN
ncbi:hypothetical protein ESOMN_v1c06980 [Williamsoniiplasma somnilux]|uniref:Lipoprotein n=1 Tax=Williamsoniiplasma somnilux TaxID=215578 RepID=A0A2K8NZ23_9MOLU|nr:hypothetical protein [Williamsoniiplasma somnilux]ATZ19080.1 hypothetical protein ESOMN_v1c06980 [Williamsoniiplasma somnilux]